MTWETALRERGEKLGVNAYLAMRIGPVGTYAALGYLDAAAGIEPPEAELRAPKALAASEAGIFAAGLDNDRYSLLKESAPDKAGYNLFNAFQHDHPELSPAQAVERAVGLRNRMMAVYLRLREQIIPGASEQLTRYFEALDLVIAGNIAFGTRTLRYFAPDALPDVHITRTPPSDLPAGPPPYPAIAWWWDQAES